MSLFIESYEVSECLNGGAGLGEQMAENLSMSSIA